MPRLVIEGTQWGDEGKGKITDFLAQTADVVVRFQGGNNAGHTINFNHEKYALKLVPSGIFNPRIKNVIANGVVVNPKALIEELEGLESRGITEYQLFISNRAQILMPYHIDLDAANEAVLGKSNIGTTKKGIGPCYMDKASRNGLRMGDLLNLDYLKERLETVLPIKNLELKSYGLKEYSFDELFELLISWKNKLEKHIIDTSILINGEIEKDKKILFEGAQGVMLCVEHGTYPYVTSSSPLACSVPLNTGIAPKYIDNVLGITKAYTTRVGEGPFATEINDDIASYIREKGHEYGTVTKRPRRIGWLDLVVLNHAKRTSGITSISLMLLDVLGGLNKIKICTKYQLNGKEIDYIPSNLLDYQNCIPVYEEFDGWKEDITSCKTFDELPINCQKYLNRIMEVTRLPISIISVGPDREQTIVMKDVWKND